MSPARRPRRVVILERRGDGKFGREDSRDG